MEDDTGGGRETSAGTTTTAGTTNAEKHEHYNNTGREIDPQHLAHLLRESAEVVERGEFGSVLYEALQDFRAYYKQKYPKKKKKKSLGKEKRPRDGSPLSKSARGSYSVKIADETVEESEDLKQSEKTTVKSTDQEEMKSEEDGGVLDASSRSVRTSKDATSKAIADDQEVNAHSNHDASVPSESSPTKVEETIKSSTSEEASEVSETKAFLPDAAPVSIATAVPVSTADADASAAPSTPERVAPNQTAPVESDGAAPAYYTNATPTSATRSSQKRGTGFGSKFKLGATLQNVKKGAMNVKKAALNVTEKIHDNIDKKHHNSHNRTSSGAKGDLGFYAETGVDMAQSSGRRKASDTRTYGYGNADKPTWTNSDFKSRVTPGMAGASGAGSLASHSEDDDEKNQNNYQSSHDTTNHGRPASDRSLGHPDSNPSAYPSVNNQGRSTTSQPSSYDSHPSENGESESGGVVPSESFEEADPIIMEGGARHKFQRPANKNSPLVVSGWIEQFRRSKMRHVWKEVLASLVEGRKPGEVTTLWIQREIANPATGKKELEALHRFPLKIVEEVTLTQDSTDYQFRLKVYGSTEDIVFRCNEAPNDSLRWVQILNKYVKLVNETTDNDENKAVPESSTQQQQQQAPSTKGMAVRDLRAICHGAGVNTNGMERSELEAAAEDVQRRGTYFDQRGVAGGPVTPHASRYNNDPNTQQYTPQKQQQQQQEYPHTNQANAEPPPTPTESAPPQQEQPKSQQRLGIKELRAICHGAGVNTMGMERRELEAAAKEVQSRGTYFNAEIGMHAASEDDSRHRREELRKQQQKHEEMRRRQEAEERHRREVEDARRKAAAVEQEAHRRAAAAAEQEAHRKAAEEEARRRMIHEQRRRAAEEEARRRAAAEEQLRRQREAQEAQTRYAQQQAAWNQQQQAEGQRRRAAEQQAAAERLRREEALRKQQQWAAPAPGAHPQQQQRPHQYHQQPQSQPQRQHGYPQQQQQWQQQQSQQHQRPPPQQQQARNHTPLPPQQPQKQHSGSDSKYAKMANQSNDDGQAAITKIKHGILIQWALQPPQLQMLRPIAALVTTIHAIFPPALGVPAHDYFKKWKPITREDVAGATGQPDDAKLKKSVRKIRFFLHPDKLPKDLDEEQSFTVKMLWDITSDAWAEYEKNKEDLDWVNN